MYTSQNKFDNLQIGNDYILLNYWTQMLVTMFSWSRSGFTFKSINQYPFIKLQTVLKVIVKSWFQQ